MSAQIQHKGPFLFQSLAALCQQHAVAVLYAFGSRAQQARDWLEGKIPSLPASQSDLDLGALPETGVYLRARQKVDLTLDLEDFFDVPRVDLVILPEAPPYLASNIIQGERLYARDEDQADEFDLYVLRKAGDLMPFHRQRLAMIFGDQG